MVKIIRNFFDNLEDKNRAWLSRRPILYAFLGGAGVIIFWRGIWHFNDYLAALVSFDPSQNQALQYSTLPWWDGIASLAVGGAMLLATGIFVSSFIGNEVILSGLKREKKLAEKTEAELEEEGRDIDKLAKELRLISKRLDKIEKVLRKK